MAVAVGKSSSIVTDGLVLYLDAANPLNYYLNSVEVLVVAGGGGGGHQHGGGGGGGGGVIYRSNYSVTPGTSISLSVGAGGVGGSSLATNGQNSTFGVLTAIGGGYGGSESAQQSGNSGGSGGGGSGFSTPTSGGSGTAGQGFRGGDGASRADAGAVYGSGGGGGGAGGPGARGAEGNEALGTAGDGGRGLLFNISGYPRYYGGGGGGGYWGGNFAGVGRGGIGGGGDGGAGTSTIYAPRPGKANTGGGGGGSKGDGSTARDGAAGGSGIVIVRYPGPQKATGGTITQVGGYTIHSFTSTGSATFTPNSLPSNGSSVAALFDLTPTLTSTYISPPTTIVTENGPVYNTDSLGNISLDGINDRILISTNNNSTIRAFDSTTQFVIKLPNYDGGQRCILSYRSFSGGEMYIGKSAGGIFVYYNSLSPPGYTVGSITNNTIAICHVVCDSTNNLLSIYINGTLAGSASMSGWSSSYHTGLYLGYDLGGTNEYMLGNFYNFAHYNKVLSASEINQNYNALRERFGI